MQRFLAGLLLTTLVIAGGANGAAPGWTDHLVINELQPNPSGSDRGNEWVEIYNPTAIDTPLDGWTLQDHRGRIHDLAGLVAPAFGYIVVTLGGSLQLVNGGGDLALVDPDAATIDRVRYGNVGSGQPRAQAAPGEAESLARYYVHGDGRFAANGDDLEWYIEDEPSPGAANELSSPLF